MVIVGFGVGFSGWFLYGFCTKMSWFCTILRVSLGWRSFVFNNFLGSNAQNILFGPGCPLNEHVPIETGRKNSTLAILMPQQHFGPNDALKTCRG